MSLRAAQIKTEQNIETLRLRARLISPVHIGSYQQSLSSTEYLIYRNTAYVVDAAKLYGLQNGPLTEQILDRWVQGERLSLTEVFEQWNARRGGRGINPASISYYQLAEHGDLQGSSQYRPFQRNGANRAYIAGSSLKGALRNAWLYHYLKQHEDVLKTQATKIAVKLKQADEEWERAENNGLLSNQQSKDLIKKQEKWLADEFNKLLPENVFRAGYGRQAPQRPQVQDDLFRSIGVSDSPLLSDNSLAAERVDVLCQYKDFPCDREGNLWLRQKQGLTLVEECLQEGQSFEFELSLNRQLLSFYRSPEDAPRDLRDLLNQATAFFKEVWQSEKKFFEPGEVSDCTAGELEASAVTVPKLDEFYSKNVPAQGRWLLRLGAGSGLLSITPDLLLKPDSEDETDAFRYDGSNLLWLLGYYAFWQQKDKADIFPKSRKVVWRRNQNHILPMGWLELEEIKE